MNRYILDTDIVSYLWDEASPYHSQVIEHLNNLNDSDIVGITVISIYELTYGMDSFTDEKLKAFSISGKIQKKGFFKRSRRDFG